MSKPNAVVLDEAAYNDLVAAARQRRGVDLRFYRNSRTARVGMMDAVVLVDWLEPVF